MCRIEMVVPLCVLVYKLTVSHINMLLLNGSNIYLRFGACECKLRLPFKNEDISLGEMVAISQNIENFLKCTWVHIFQSSGFRFVLYENSNTFKYIDNPPPHNYTCILNSSYKKTPKIQLKPSNTMFVVGLVSVLNFKHLILIQVQYDLDTEQVQKTRKDQCKNDFNKKYLFANIAK